MKLFAHNMLMSKMMHNAMEGLPPLKLTVTEVNQVTEDFHPALVAKVLPRLDWKTLVEAANACGPEVAADVPPAIVEDFEKNQEFLKKAHHLLFEVDVISGVMECSETGRKFEITDGIPNLLANDEEEEGSMNEER